MEDNGIPQYRLNEEQEMLDEIHEVVEDNIRHNLWYCPSCGVPYQQKWGFRSRCSECGNSLEVQ